MNKQTLENQRSVGPVPAIRIMPAVRAMRAIPVMQAGPSQPIRRRGFTLMEMIVVIVILLTLLTLVLPAFVSIKKSSEYSISQELVKQAVRDAHGRALAARYDTAVVFAYSPDLGLQMIPCNMIGRVLDGNLRDPADRNNPQVTRDVFAPVISRKAVTLPAGVSVRGHVEANKVDARWYEPTNDGGQRYTPGEEAWVFPETDFYSRQLPNGDAGTFADVGRNRQTFMIRFAARTGQLVSGEAAPAVVVLPRVSASGRESGLAVSARFDTAPDAGALASSILDRLDWSKEQKQGLLGDSSSDKALVRSVTRLAVYRERELAQALGVRLDAISQTVYLLPSDWQTRTDVIPRYMVELSSLATTPKAVRRWFEGFKSLVDETIVEKTSGSRPVIYSIHPQRGEATEESSQ